MDSPTFGAAGNGTTDDSAALQAALTACSVAGGGVVRLGAHKTYLLGTTLTVGSNTTVVGAGRSSVLKAKASTSVTCLKVTGSHVSISDLAIDGNKANVTALGVGTQYKLLNAIYITGADDVQVERCYVHDFYEGGILADASTNLIIRGNRIKDGNDNGIFLRPDQANPGVVHASILGNVVSGCAFSGIQAVRSDHLTIAGNVSYSNGPTAAQGDGIGVEGCRWVSIAGNDVHDNGIMGICVRGTDEGGASRVSSHVAVVGNVASSQAGTSGDCGIQVVDADDVLLDGNVCSANWHGIVIDKVNGALAGVTRLKLSANVSRDNLHTGIHIGANIGAGPFLLTDNWVADNADDNVYTNSPIWVQGGVFAGATGAGQEGLHLDSGADKSIIDGAFFFDNKDNGILISGSTANVEIRNCVADNIVGTNQARLLYEGDSAGPTHLIGNRIRSQNTADFRLAHASSVAKFNDGNSGTLDQNSGSATLAALGTAIVVTHGLYKTPARVEITPTADSGIAFRFWVSTKTSTQFTINAAPAVTNATTFDWSAKAVD